MSHDKHKSLSETELSFRPMFKVVYRLAVMNYCEIMFSDTHSNMCVSAKMKQYSMTQITCIVFNLSLLLMLLIPTSTRIFFDNPMSTRKNFLPLLGYKCRWSAVGI